MSSPSASRLRRSRLVDKAVAVVITTGGALVLLAVALLVVFLVAECLPLFVGAKLTAEGVGASSAKVLVATEDEYRNNVVVVASDGAIHVIPKEGKATHFSLNRATPPLGAAALSTNQSLLAAIDSVGVLGVWVIRADISWQGDRRVITPSFRFLASKPIPTGSTLLAVSGDADTPFVLIGSADKAILVKPTTEEPPIELSLRATVVAGTLGDDGHDVYVASSTQLAWFHNQSDGTNPAPEATVPLASPPTVMTMVLGDVTCLVGDESGTVNAWQVVTGSVAASKVLEKTASFPGSGRVVALSSSQRDKSFAVLRSSFVEVCHLTSRRVLARLDNLPTNVTTFGFAPRRDGVFVVGQSGEVKWWRLDMPHPEVSFGTLFTPVRYEGYHKADLAWQSTGATNAFESKLSLIPLLLGTFKGAFYALLISGPCALAAALYVSQFAPAGVKQITKPVIELMSALPSVVVGFIAALLLAPLLQHHIVGVLLAFVAIPFLVLCAAAMWEACPVTWRRGIRPSHELVIISSILVITVAVSLSLGSHIEGWLFSGDFKQWLTSFAGINYDQRNAVVVGFALGFAVIPIIFTLAEDAFSNVPQSLVSASLALGASRWQAARTVVLPASSPGVFAAIMTGLGRAVGETMIVLMATGNTPILSFSPFDGMRTMAACIAVELPEAPHGGSLFRVLMLTALILFALTFVINTVAVLVAERLRKRFGRLVA